MTKNHLLYCHFSFLTYSIYLLRPTLTWIIASLLLVHPFYIYLAVCKMLYPFHQEQHKGRSINLMLVSRYLTFKYHFRGCLIFPMWLQPKTTTFAGGNNNIIMHRCEMLYNEQQTRTEKNEGKFQKFVNSDYLWMNIGLNKNSWLIPRLDFVIIEKVCSNTFSNEYVISQ